MMTEQLFLEYLAVAQAWNGLGQSMTVREGLRRLAPAIEQTQSPLLSQRARVLSNQIIFGRSYDRKVV